MFELYLEELEKIGNQDQLPLESGIVKQIKQKNSIECWVGWYKESTGNIIPIGIFNFQLHKNLYIKTARMLLEFKYDIKLIEDGKNKNNFQGLVLFGYGFTKNDFSIIVGIFHSVLKSNKIEENDLENLLLLLERGIGTSKSISKETLTGTWGELAVISFAKNTGKFVKGWAKNLNSIHDFTFLEEVDLEVKSTLKNERIHYISSSQIEYENKDKIFLSLLLREVDEGKTIFDLYNLIISKLDNFTDSEELKLILLNKCLDRLGEALYLANLKLDLEFAKNSLKAFYPHELGVSKVKHPVIKADYQIIIDDSYLINSDQILNKISKIFI